MKTSLLVRIPFKPLGVGLPATAFCHRGWAIACSRNCATAERKLQQANGLIEAKGATIVPRNVHGILPAVLTPFTADGQAVDTAALGRHIDWLIDRGVHGLFVCGTNGEGPLLSPDERRRVAETAVAAAQGRVPVLVQTGGITTREAVVLTRHAQAVGADGAAVVTPWYFAWDEASLFDHFSTVAAAVPDFPVYLYNIPGNTRNEIKPDLAARLASAHGNVAGVKDSSKDLNRTEEFLAALGPQHRVFVGTDSLIVPALSLGAAGGVAGVANVFPEIMVSMYEAYRAGEFAEARRLQFLTTKVRDAIKGPAGVMLYKRIVEVRGVPMGGPRRPARPATAEEESRAVAALQELGVL